MNTEAIRRKFKIYATLNGLDATFDTENGKYEQGACYHESDTQNAWQGAEWGYQQAVKDMEEENDIYRFIEFVDGIQGRDAGGADVLSWSDISSATDLKDFLEVYKAHKERS